MTNKKCQPKSEKCPGGKLSKVSTTGMTAANAVGDKILMFVIGKAQKPCCFKNVADSLPILTSRKGLMDGVLFEEWVRESDWTSSSEERSVELVIDNCLAHAHIESLKSIKMIFLRPDSTSTTQLMDQCVIRSLKAKYPKNMVQKIIQVYRKIMPC